MIKQEHISMYAKSSIRQYPDRICEFVVSRIENTFLEFRNITDTPNSGSKRTLTDEKKLDILLEIHKNLQGEFPPIMMLVKRLYCVF